MKRHNESYKIVTKNYLKTVKRKVTNQKKEKLKRSKYGNSHKTQAKIKQNNNVRLPIEVQNKLSDHHFSTYYHHLKPTLNNKIRKRKIPKAHQERFILQTYENVFENLNNNVNKYKYQDVDFDPPMTSKQADEQYSIENIQKRQKIFNNALFHKRINRLIKGSDTKCHNFKKTIIDISETLKNPDLFEKGNLIHTTIFKKIM